MAQFKSQDLLQNASVAVSVGTQDKPLSARPVFKLLAATAVLLAASTFSPAQAQNHEFDGQVQGVSVQTNQVVGEVISVRHIRENSRRSHRGEISPRSIAGAVIGGALGNQIGGGNGRQLSTLAGALLGGSVANRIADRRATARNGYDNARQIQDNDLVTVRVSNGGSFETYEIEQPAGYGLRRGDAVALMVSKDGQSLLALPIEVQNDYAPDRPSSRARRPR